VVAVEVDQEFIDFTCLLIKEELSPTPFVKLRLEIGEALDRFDDRMRKYCRAREEEGEYAHADSLCTATWQLRRQIMMAYWLTEKSFESAKWTRDE